MTTDNEAAAVEAASAAYEREVLAGATHEQAWHVALEAAIAAHTAASAGEVGALDRSAPDRVWLQVDTGGDPDDRSQPMPRESWDELSWHHEPIGGQEVEYVRVDLAGHPPAAVPADALERLVEKWQRYAEGNFDDAANARSRCADELAALIQKGAV